MRWEPFIGRRLAYASRTAEQREPMKKLSAALCGVGACQLRLSFAVVLRSYLRCVEGLASSSQESAADFLGILAR